MLSIFTVLKMRDVSCFYLITFFSLVQVYPRHHCNMACWAKICIDII